MLGYYSIQPNSILCFVLFCYGYITFIFRRFVSNPVVVVVGVAHNNELDAFYLCISSIAINDKMKDKKCPKCVVVDFFLLFGRLFLSTEFCRLTIIPEIVSSLFLELP